MVKYGDVYLPSDFGGYIHITGSSVFNRGAPAKVAKRTATEFERWVSSGAFSSNLVAPGRLAEELALAQGELAAMRENIEASRQERAADAAEFRRLRGYPSRQ
jgi:hypothetical protein